METPTEWSVTSRLNSPPGGKRRDETSPTSVAQRPRSRQSRQGSESQSPGRSPSVGRGPSASPPDRARLGLPMETPAEYPSSFSAGPGIKDFVAYPSNGNGADAMVHNEGALLQFGNMFSDKSCGPPVRIRGTPQLTQNKRHVVEDPLAGASTSSIGSFTTLPAQDSVTSTVGSVSGVRPVKQNAGFKGPGPRAQPGKGMSSSAGFNAAPSGNSLRAMMGSSGAASSSTGFANATYNKTVPGGGAALKGPAADFSTPLGFGDRSPLPRSSTAQMPRNGAAPAADSGVSPPTASSRQRSMTAGGQRDVTWGGSKSTGSLPLTRAPQPPAQGGSSSPTRQRRRVTDEKTAKAELAAANSEGHLPELLPAFKPGKIHKGPKPPTWLVAI